MSATWKARLSARTPAGVIGRWGKDYRHGDGCRSATAACIFAYRLSRNPSGRPSSGSMQENSSIFLSPEFRRVWSSGCGGRRQECFRCFTQFGPTRTGVRIEYSTRYPGRRTQTPFVRTSSWPGCIAPSSSNRPNSVWLSELTTCGGPSSRSHSPTARRKAGFRIEPGTSPPRWSISTNVRHERRLSRHGRARTLALGASRVLGGRINSTWEAGQKKTGPKPKRLP